MNILIFLSFRTPPHPSAGIMDKIEAAVGSRPKPIWFDPKNVGLAAQTEKKLSDIEYELSTEPMLDAQEVLVVEIGEHWAARHSSIAAQWLSAHVGKQKG